MLTQALCTSVVCQTLIIGVGFAVENLFLSGVNMILSMLRGCLLDTVPMPPVCRFFFPMRVMHLRKNYLPRAILLCNSFGFDFD